MERYQRDTGDRAQELIELTHPRRIACGRTRERNASHRGRDARVVLDERLEAPAARTTENWRPANLVERVERIQLGLVTQLQPCDSSTPDYADHGPGLSRRLGGAV